MKVETNYSKRQRNFERVKLKLEHKQFSKKSRQTFAKEWEDRFDVSLDPGF